MNVQRLNGQSQNFSRMAIKTVTLRHFLNNFSNPELASLFASSSKYSDNILHDSIDTVYESTEAGPFDSNWIDVVKIPALIAADWKKRTLTSFLALNQVQKRHCNTVITEVLIGRRFLT